MNNNYHTQIDKQKNILNEIAANNQLLQQAQQMSNFQGTPIKNGTMPPMPQMSQMNQMTPQQMMYLQQMQASQQIPQQGLIDPNGQNFNFPNMPKSQINQSYPLNMCPVIDPSMNPQENYQNVNRPQMGEMDEIELSEPKVESKTRQTVTPTPSMLTQTNGSYNIQSMQPNMEQNMQPNIQTNMQPKNILPKSNNSNNSNNLKNTMPNLKSISTNSNVDKTKSSNKMTDYFIFPLLLLIIFILLVHPYTSKYLDKYLPPMKNIKGYAIRGLILAIAYIVIKLLVSTFSK